MDVFNFEDRLHSTLLVHYFQVEFQLFFAMLYCSILFILSEQLGLSWRISIVVCPDKHGKLWTIGAPEFCWSTYSQQCYGGLLQQAPPFQNILPKCHYCEFIVLAILGFSNF